MDRHFHPKYYPESIREISLADQYLWPVKNSTKYTAYNGISHPIYSCNGNINFTLPLEMYPPENDVHPQIKWQQRMHMPYRGPGNVIDNPPTLQDYHMAGIPARTGLDGVQESFQLPNQSRTMHSGSTGRNRYGPLDQIADEDRLEGFYTLGPYRMNNLAPGIHMNQGQQGPSGPRFIQATMRTEPGKLPDPSGYAAGCSACSGCPGR